MPQLSVSRRTRSTPFTSRVNARGVKAYTVYNHTLLATVFQSVEADYEHLCQHVQVWDVSCERQVQIKGPDATQLVQWMTPRDLSAAQDDQCFYVPLCDEHGKLINDPIVIKVQEDCWWLSIADSDVMLWAKGLATGMQLDVEISEPAIWPIAIQGPKAEKLMQRVFGDVVTDIRFFRYKRLSFADHTFIVARSGWSKQGGFEVYVDHAEKGQQLWDCLFAIGKDLNVGPGCPNLIERIESGLLSFGSDMDMSHTPLQCGLDKYCHLDRSLNSLSLKALAKQKAEGVPARLMGLVVPHMPGLPKQLTLMLDNQEVGEVTSHCLSGAYDAWLGFAMIDTAALQILEQAGSADLLQLQTDNGHFPVLCTELPYDFSGLPLQPRQTKQRSDLAVI